MMRLLAGLLLGVGLALALVGCDGGGPSAPTAGRALQLVGEPSTSPLGQDTTAINGRVKNVAQRPYTGQVKVTVFGADGKAIGTGYGPVVDLKPGEETTYTALVLARIELVSKIEARVELEMPG